MAAKRFVQILNPYLNRQRLSGFSTRCRWQRYGSPIHFSQIYALPPTTEIRYRPAPVVRRDSIGRTFPQLKKLPASPAQQRARAAVLAAVAREHSHSHSLDRFFSLFAGTASCVTISGLRHGAEARELYAR